MNFPTEILERLGKSGVVAGFSVDKVEHAVPLAKALIAGGIDVIELTLRTPAGMEGVKAICAEVPEMLVGVGTILTPDTVREVKAAGADFGVAPGMNPKVVQAAIDAGFPFAPGIATPSDIEAAVELGCRFLKIFPAEGLGGLPYIRNMSTPYNHLGIQYFPLGGLNALNMLEYLKEPNILTIGGSWIVQKELVEKGDWAGITARARSVSELLEHRI
ncbi:MAG: bifunctional 4-hydroxy-2-oxoglutarate aldolase/2-dehydro-3-deoxy-phosphogluconate aldolase [Luteolibacter sp.]